MTVDANAEACYSKLSANEKAELIKAFGSETFVYGSKGIGSEINTFVDRWAKKAGSSATNQVVKNRLAQLSLFDAGKRFATYSINGYQMMDMYYGQADNLLHAKRNDTIGKFIHQCMGFMGEYNSAQSGRAAYQKSWSTDKEGWASDSPQGRSWDGLTATQAISAIVRWGVRKFGGKIIFEGYGVYYNQVFLNTPARLGDTDIEARDLFTWFKPGLSTVSYGDGAATVSFYWAGVETVPNHILFILSWKWNQNRLNKPGNAIGLRALQDLADNNAMNMDLWDKFADSDRLTSPENADAAASAALVLANEDQNWGDLPAMEALFPKTAANS